MGIHYYSSMRERREQTAAEELEFSKKMSEIYDKVLKEVPCAPPDTSPNIDLVKQPYNRLDIFLRRRSRP